MKKLIALLGDIIYHKVPFTICGFSGGSKMYAPDDYIPDSIIYLHKLSEN
jgi:hypothetical protein